MRTHCQELPPLIAAMASRQRKTSSCFGWLLFFQGKEENLVFWVVTFWVVTVFPKEKRKTVSMLFFFFPKESIALAKE